MGKVFVNFKVLTLKEIIHQYLNFFVEYEHFMCEKNCCFYKYLYMQLAAEWQTEQSMHNNLTRIERSKNNLVIIKNKESCNIRKCANFFREFVCLSLIL